MIRQLRWAIMAVTMAMGLVALEYDNPGFSVPLRAGLIEND